MASGSRPTVQELADICLAGASNVPMPACPINEVYPNAFIGGEKIAKDAEELKKLGITHVLDCGPCGTDADFYKPFDIQFMCLSVQDTPPADVKQHFDPGVKFIDEALQNGKVLVNCKMGYMRGPTAMLAYLMMCKGMDVRDATKTVRDKREIKPNEALFKQLISLNEVLQK